jgi:hypothetical protein
MAGSEWKKEVPNYKDLTSDSNVLVQWNGEGWYVELNIATRKGWETVLTGTFKDIDKLNELIDSAKNMMEVED